MILDVNETTLNKINNPTMRSYAGIYVSIYNDFINQIKTSGIEIDPQDYSAQVNTKTKELEKEGAILRNNDKSIYINNISPACVACQTGRGSATYFISLKCHRDCFYCFNPNQEKYEYYLTNTRDPIIELEKIKNRRERVEHLALTGGEPLLHKEKTIEFFNYAREQFPDAYTRLYTSGDHIDVETLESLRDEGLQEIRFSIRMHDLAKGQRNTYDSIALASEYIPYVMVEMPVLPGTLEEMSEILVELDRLNLYSINLLELCFPLYNADIFNEKGFKIKKRPFRVLYDYWYAGGLPVAGSELVCLDLVKFALDNKLSLGVHYCSVENKQTGQIFQQNQDQNLSDTTYFSPQDYFIKIAKVFGEDIEPVKEIFSIMKYFGFEENQEHNSLEFQVKLIPMLASLNIEVGISSNVFEKRNGETYLRELKIDLTTPQKFKLEDL